MRNFARDVACPIDPVKKSGSSQSFYALFRDTTSAVQCSDQQLCLSSQSCWEHVLYGDKPNVVGFATEVITSASCMHACMHGLCLVCILLMVCLFLCDAVPLAVYFGETPLYIMLAFAHVNLLTSTPKVRAI